MSTAGSVGTVPESRARRLDTRTLVRDEPVVLRGFAASWPATGSWSWDRLAAALSGVTAPVEVGPGASASPAQFLAGKRTVPLPLGTFLASLGRGPVDRPGPALYLLSTEVPRWAPALMADLPDPADVLPPSARLPCSPTFVWHHCDRMFFFGPAGTVTHMHTDPQPGVLVQISGTKVVHLAPPEATGRLRELAEPLPGAPRHWLGVDLAGPARPLVPGVRRCVLGPGDGILIPAYWWHHVRSVTPAVSVNYGWRAWLDLTAVRRARHALRRRHARRCP